MRVFEKINFIFMGIIKVLSYQSLRVGGLTFVSFSLLSKNKDALKRYASDYGDHPAKQRIKQSAIDIIRSRDFWVQLESIRELLQPLDEELKKSESGKSHLGHVLSRWLRILATFGESKKDRILLSNSNHFWSLG